MAANASCKKIEAGWFRYAGARYLIRNGDSIAGVRAPAVEMRMPLALTWRAARKSRFNFSRNALIRVDDGARFHHRRFRHHAVG